MNTIIILLLTTMVSCGINDAYQEEDLEPKPEPDSVDVRVEVLDFDTDERIQTAEILFDSTVVSSDGIFTEKRPEEDVDINVHARAEGYQEMQEPRMVNTMTDVSISIRLQKTTEPEEPKPPIARFSFDPHDDLSVSFDGSESYDPDGSNESLTHSWDFGDNSEVGSGATTEHTYDESGSYDVTLTVTDADGLTSKETHTVAVGMENQKPEANFSVEETDELTVVFRNESTDPDGDELSYTWQFGDGKASEAEHPTHTYEKSGDYDVTLTSTDPKGASDMVTKTITVTKPKPPVAEFTFDVDELTVSFDAGESTDPDGDIVSYSWEFGDGNTGSGITPEHTYEESGSYDATLTVTDNDGLTDQATKEVTPQASEAPGKIKVKEVTCSKYQKATGTIRVKVENGFESITLEQNEDVIRHKDGLTPSDWQEYKFSDLSAGTYKVIPKKNGKTTTKSITVETCNRPPTAHLTEENHGLTIAYDASGSSDPDGEIVEYRWDWTNDGSIDSVTTTPHVEHTFDDEGDFDTRVVVVDDDGATDEATTRVCPKVILSDEYKHKVTFGGDEKIWVSDHKDRPYDTLLDYGEVRPILTDKDPYGKVKIKVKFKLDSDEVDTEHFALKIYFKQDKSDAFRTPIYPDQPGKDGWTTATKEVDASHFEGHAKDLAGIKVIHGDKIDDSKSAGEDDVYFSKHDTSGTLWFYWRVLL